MKSIYLITAFLFSLNACAMGARKPDFDVLQKRKDQDKIWRSYDDSEDSAPLGKMCNPVCVKRKHNGECKEWKINVRNFAEMEHFLFFRNGGFIFIDEDNL